MKYNSFLYAYSVWKWPTESTIKVLHVKYPMVIPSHNLHVTVGKNHRKECEQESRKK